MKNTSLMNIKYGFIKLIKITSVRIRNLVDIVKIILNEVIKWTEDLSW